MKNASSMLQIALLLLLIYLPVMIFLEYNKCKKIPDQHQYPHQRSTAPRTPDDPALRERWLDGGDHHLMDPYPVDEFEWNSTEIFESSSFRFSANKAKSDRILPLNAQPHLKIKNLSLELRQMESEYSDKNKSPDFVKAVSKRYVKA